MIMSMNYLDDSLFGIRFDNELSQVHLVLSNNKILSDYISFEH